MEFIFRKIDETNPNDIEQFNELMNDLSTHAKDKELLSKKIREFNSRDDAYLMVVEDTENSKICASLIAVTFGDFCDLCRPVMIVENVVTHHSYQRRGIGKMMFEEIEKWGRKHDVSYIMLCSSMHRKQAHIFYNSIGYSEVKGYKKYL
ncbi:MAG: GNAT family N-acetyltransferase [Firmicutes bacterium]|nr:GNAT family N-acetyltransferase [Bacillota bacterium]